MTKLHENRQKPKRIRNRATKKRLIPDMSPKPGRPSMWLWLHYSNEGKFDQSAYDHLLHYCCDRVKAIHLHLHPQDISMPPGSPNRTMIIHIESAKKFYWAIKQEVSRYGKGMSCEEVTDDPFESPFPGNVESEFAKGA